MTPPTIKQWEEHLIQGGIQSEKIVRHHRQVEQQKPLEGDIVILCTKYDLQKEAEIIFKELPPTHQELVALHHTNPSFSNLFPDSSAELVGFLARVRAGKPTDVIYLWPILLTMKLWLKMMINVLVQL